MKLLERLLSQLLRRPAVPAHETSTDDKHIAHLRSSVASAPGDWTHWSNLGLILRSTHDLDGAEEALRRAVELAPRSAEAHSNLGLVLHELGGLQQAETVLREAIRLRASLPEPQFNLGNTLAAQVRYGEAARCYRNAIRLRHEFADAHWHLALVLLAMGDWQTGFEQFEWRWKLPKQRRFARDFGSPPWRGENLDGKTIFLWWEQGYGDTLQFLRYAPLLAARGARVLLDVQPELTRLAAALPGVSRVLGKNEDVPPFDFHLPLMSLPHRAGTRPDAVPGDTPYLHADAAEAQSWAARLGNATGLRVGLCWSSGLSNYDAMTFMAGASKSMPLAALSSLAGIRKIELHSLQTGSPAGEALARPHGLKLRDWSGELRDFSATAALIENLDLVISVDTATAHLAGALGKPVWLLLKAQPCWRWMPQQETSPWYPGMRLFRQTQPGDWTAPVTAVAHELGLLAQTHGTV